MACGVDWRVVHKGVWYRPVCGREAESRAVSTKGRLTARLFCSRGGRPYRRFSYLSREYEVQSIPSILYKRELGFLCNIR